MNDFIFPVLLQIGRSACGLQVCALVLDYASGSMVKYIVINYGELICHGVVTVFPVAGI